MLDKMKTEEGAGSSLLKLTCLWDMHMRKTSRWWLKERPVSIFPCPSWCPHSEEVNRWTQGRMLKAYNWVADMGLNNKDCFVTKLQCKWFVTDSSEAFNLCVWKLDCTKRKTSLCMKTHCFRRVCVFCSLCVFLWMVSYLWRQQRLHFFFFWQKKTMLERWKLSEQNWICHVAQHHKDSYLRTERKWQSAPRQGLSSVLHACSHLSWVVAWKPQSACWSVNFIWRIFYGIVFFPPLDFEVYSHFLGYPQMMTYPSGCLHYKDRIFTAESFLFAHFP